MENELHELQKRYDRKYQEIATVIAGHLGLKGDKAEYRANRVISHWENNVSGKRGPGTPLELLLQELYDIQIQIWRVDEELGWQELCNEKG
jgi:hypothetical protein